MKCSKREITLSSEVALVNYVNFSFIASLRIRRKRKKNISLIVGAFSFLRACANREKWKRKRRKMLDTYDGLRLQCMHELLRKFFTQFSEMELEQILQ